jgi:hypothetical protein
MPLDELRDGLEILKTKNADAPVVTTAYIITVPAVKKVDLSGGEQTAIEALGWVEHPVYLSYYYPAQTLTELADVTGEGSGDLPVLEPIVPIPSKT